MQGGVGTSECPGTVNVRTQEQQRWGHSRGLERATAPVARSDWGDAAANEGRSWSVDEEWWIEMREKCGGEWRGVAGRWME